MSLISVVSTPSLEKWDWRSPERGIGGSETSHVRMAQALKSRGFDILSYAPVPEGPREDATGLLWLSSNNVEPALSKSRIIINYRDPKLFDAPKPTGAKWWFVAQDVDYGDQWTPERLAKVDRYLTLCPTHAAYTKARYPQLHTENRLFISSNGIQSADIAKNIAGIRRNPKRLMYASSPDRGLSLILENWFRIRERVPEAEFHVFYGFQNYETIIALNGPGDWRAHHMAELGELLKQPGVVWHDRIGQQELWQEWAKSNIWLYPTDFPETSCITSMEAQACGVIPVTTNFWALKSNVFAGYKFDGLPQKSDVVRGLMLERVISLLEDSADWDAMRTGFRDNGEEFDDVSEREEMQIAARRRFDWERVADQWENWIHEDTGHPPTNLPPAMAGEGRSIDNYVMGDRPDGWRQRGFGSAVLPMAA